MSLYDYPAQEQWGAFQRLAQMLMQTPFSAEGIVTRVYTDANGTQHIGLHRIPDRSGLWRYLGTTLLMLTMLGCAAYNGIQAFRRYQRNRTRMAEIQEYYENCLNPKLIASPGKPHLTAHGMLPCSAYPAKAARIWRQSHLENSHAY
ncbi:Intracellular growth attenuator protein igaA [Citrobacter koseri]|uniref:Intracellular growth attenuator protein igaA n=1 Tax=Citrobacter koseri TaxID=545 RepID=A0A2X2YGG9_CITKO|nr:Intracellular growth attenuator protein igaA [Citrobacter koseri]